MKSDNFRLIFMEKNMKRLIIFGIFLALALTACGAPAASEPAVSAPEQAPIQEQTAHEQPTAEANDPAPAPVEEAAPTTEPESAQPAASGEAIEVIITLGDNWVMSSQTTFKVGVPYKFVVINGGNRVHNFNINKPAEMTTNGIRAALDNAILKIPNEQLQPGMTATVEFTFTEAAPAGTLEFSCLIERHYRSGQILPIIVEE
jgi:uncharacterized cupredoxin-like copper-binding protein